MAKREGAYYNTYNYMYRYLMDNFEPQQLEASIACEAAEKQLVKEGKKFCVNRGEKYNEDQLVSDAREAITNFVNNKGEHGDTGNNLGKGYNNSFNTIKESISDLRW